MSDHADEIAAADDMSAQVNRFVEVNVRDQLIRLARTNIIQQAFAADQPLQLHGWVYDMRDGLINPVLEIKASTRLDDAGAPHKVL
ncbi:carbonic anhydrase [Sphingobium xenophagum]|uniref:carbonic anhydrase n=1 Tax=Sphingobium xenophagum TaxID=121428 RepID=UPI0038F724DF